MKRKIEPIPLRPKFQRGERVKVSPVGVEWQIAPPGTMGTVEDCTLAVRVRIDGKEFAKYYAPDFWERPFLTE